MLNKIFTGLVSIFLLSSSAAMASETYIQHIQEAKNFLKQEFGLPKKQNIYEPSKEEKQESRKVFELAVSHRLIEAQQEYEKLMKEFPESPKIASDYVLFLVNRHKFDSAIRLTETFSKKFPESIEISILKFSLEKYQSLHTRRNKKEKSSHVFQELDLLLAAWNQLRLEVKN